MKIAFLFSGQGAQYPGMMQDIANQEPVAKEVFEIAGKALSRDISRLCFSGTQEELDLTHNTQPCMLAADLAAYAVVKERGFVPDAVAGFSLGEYGALVAAGVIGLDEVFPLIQARADFMQDAVPVGEGGMAVVLKRKAEEVEALCEEVEGYVIPVNYNCPGQTVVSGKAEAIDRFLELAKEKKYIASKLPVSAPFHCDLMSPAADALKGCLENIVFNNPEVPIYMNYDAQPEIDKSNVVDKLVLQAKSPVRWEQILRNMRAAGIDTFVEFGPGHALTGFVSKTFKKDKDVRMLNVNSLETLEETVAALQER